MTLFPSCLFCFFSSLVLVSLFFTSHSFIIIRPCVHLPLTALCRVLFVIFLFPDLISLVLFHLLTCASFFIRFHDFFLLFFYPLRLTSEFFVLVAFLHNFLSSFFSSSRLFPQLLRFIFVSIMLKRLGNVPTPYTFTVLSSIFSSPLFSSRVQWILSYTYIFWVGYIRVTLSVFSSVYFRI